MVNTGDILKAEQSQKTADAQSSDDKLDDVMLAMDVVDTLRHERLMVEKELSSEDRRNALIQRLRDIYKAQGISVPDDVLMDGVLALEEHRFAFTPAKKSFSTRLAKIYINRSKWGPLVLTIIFIIFAALGLNYAAFERPAQLESQRLEKLLSQEMPEQLKNLYDSAMSIAASDDIKEQISDVNALAAAAIADKDAMAAERYISQLEVLNTDLNTSYSVRVVYGDGRDSGFIRQNDQEADIIYNYYLIVEGVTPSGDLANVTIVSEEDQKSRRTQSWALRVSKADFDRVADDKRDDRIIQNAVIGRKKRGFLKPEYTIQTDGGTILDW